MLKASCDTVGDFSGVMVSVYFCLPHIELDLALSILVTLAIHLGVERWGSVTRE